MRRGGLFGKIIIIILCIDLAGGLGYFLLQYRQEERMESERLREEAEKIGTQERRFTPKPIPADEVSDPEEESSGDTSTTEETHVEGSDPDTSEVKPEEDISVKESQISSGDTFEEITETVSEKISDVEEDSEETAESETEAEAGSDIVPETDTSEETILTSSEEAAADEETAEPEENGYTPVSEITMISCRGDSWQQGEDADRTLGWPVKLQAVLDEQKIELTVFDGTWDMSGTLSQMSYAGVPLHTVSEFINGHKEAGLSDVRTETVVRRDLHRKIVERTDYDAIPVICIGYFGGFGRDLEELIEQQKLILETYQLPQADEENTDKENDGEEGISGCYLILGHTPNGWTDINAYEEAMTKAWGDHYISLNSLGGDVFSDDFRQKVADTIYLQLQDKGYISAD